jgi:hypothetical protein
MLPRLPEGVDKKEERLANTNKQPTCVGDLVAATPTWLLNHIPFGRPKPTFSPKVIPR